MLQLSNDDILKVDDVLKLEFEGVVNFLAIKKQQKDLEYYSTAKSTIEQKTSKK
jgi:hypothetical protein